MQSTTGSKRGDVALVTFPFTDLTSSKKRPTLVISPDEFNTLNQDLVLPALPKKSTVKLTKVFTIHSALIVKRIGSLKEQKMEHILKAIREFYS